MLPNLLIFKVQYLKKHRDNFTFNLMKLIPMRVGSGNNMRHRRGYSINEHAGHKVSNTDRVKYAERAITFFFTLITTSLTFTKQLTGEVHEATATTIYAWLL